MYHIIQCLQINLHSKTKALVISKKQTWKCFNMTKNNIFNIIFNLLCHKAGKLYAEHQKLAGVNTVQILQS